MKTITTVLLAVLLAGCAGQNDPRADDVFTNIARGWEGAHINDMIHVWGDPRLLEQDDEQGGAGFARWAIFSKYEDRARCEATATFDDAGLIRDIEVVSVNCPPKRRVSWRENWNIEQLRRPVAPDPDGEAAGKRR